MLGCLSMRQHTHTHTTVYGAAECVRAKGKEQFVNVHICVY